jgi:transposase InsO family protein
MWVNAMRLSPTSRIAVRGIGAEPDVDRRIRCADLRFTYIWMAQGWLHVAAIIDLYSRCVAGWWISPAMTSQLVTDAR